MSKSKLKGMKMVLSKSTRSTPSVPAISTRSAPTPDVAPHNSMPSSSDDSNLNEDGTNQTNNTRFENLQPINETSNLNTVDRNGRQMKRWRTTLKELWSLPSEEKVLVKANHLGQPIGPEAQLLAGFLGMLARSGQRVGLHYESWHKVPKTLKDELFKFIEANKDKHPDSTIRWQWEQLVDYWYSRKGEEVSSGRKIGRLELFRATHTKKDGSHMNVETEQIMEKANEKLSQCETMDEDMQMIESNILSQVIENERFGRVRGVGLGPTPTSYYGQMPNRNSASSSTPSREFVERFHQMEQEMQQMKEEREQERAQREQERAQHEQQCAQYNALLNFLQNQFPGVAIPGVNIGASISQSQDQSRSD